MDFRIAKVIDGQSSYWEELTKIDTVQVIGYSKCKTLPRGYFLVKRLTPSILPNTGIKNVAIQTAENPTTWKWESYTGKPLEYYQDDEASKNYVWVEEECLSLCKNNADLKHTLERVDD